MRTIRVLGLILATYGANAKGLVDLTARENILQSVQDLLSRSKILAELVEAGKVKVAGGFYTSIPETSIGSTRCPGPRVGSRLDWRVRPGQSSPGTSGPY